MFKLAEKNKAPKRARVVRYNRVDLPTATRSRRQRCRSPPETSIWKGPSAGIWGGHCPPYKRIHKQKNGLSEEDCPYKNLLDAEHALAYK